MKESLSSLRFFFSFLVFIGHLGLTKVSVGHAFFIILSGFILMYVYEKRLISNSISKKEFFLKRLQRIYPLHIITLLVSILFVIYEIHENFIFFSAKFFVNFFLLQAFIPLGEIYFSFNGVSWNVSVLMFCYFVFPFIVPYFSTITLRKFTFFILSVVVGIFIMMFFVPQKLHHALFYISPFLRIFDFIFGIYLFKLSNYFLKKEHNYTVLEAFSLFVFFSFFIVANLFPEIFLPFAYSIYFWIPLGFLILIFSAEKGIISSCILKKSIFLLLGALSYPFYMWHQLIIRFFERFDFGYNGNAKLIFLFLICLTLTIVVSYFYTILEDKYLKKLMNKIN
ncbi:acyltransferase family protein [Flavobacterium sp.]|uniref:acyltransferase family protein n=1 Tax=Flavobacterium sp. TaxID=239 RepID=UPI0035284B0B